MRTQRRTVIDPMYIEDADVMKGLRIIRDGLEGLQIAKNYKNKFDNREVYLLIGKLYG